MSIEKLRHPRYKVIADYPNPTNTPYVFKKGEVVQFDDEESVLLWKEPSSDGTRYHPESFERYPAIFKELKWFEERTLDELMSVNYVRITIYTGYWRVGDVVNVTDYKIDTKNKKLELYILDGTQQSIPERCEPATFDEYKADKAKRSGRKVEQ